MNLAIQICEALGIRRPAGADTRRHFPRRAGTNRGPVDSVPPRGAGETPLDVGVRPAVGTDLRVAQYRDIHDRVDSPWPLGAEKSGSRQDADSDPPGRRVK